MHIIFLAQKLGYFFDKNAISFNEHGFEQHDEKKKSVVQSTFWTTGKPRQCISVLANIIIHKHKNSKNLDGKIYFSFHHKLLHQEATFIFVRTTTGLSTLKYPLKIILGKSSQHCIRLAYVAKVLRDTPFERLSNGMPCKTSAMHGGLHKMT